LEFPFFGLTPDYRAYLFNQIHEIVFHGKGGYSFETVYNMPIWLRKFTFKSIQEFYKKEQEEVSKVSKSPSLPKVPSYTAKARK